MVTVEVYEDWLVHEFQERNPEKGSGGDGAEWEMDPASVIQYSPSPTQHVESTTMITTTTTTMIIMNI